MARTESWVVVALLGWMWWSGPVQAGPVRCVPKIIVDVGQPEAQAGTSVTALASADVAPQVIGDDGCEPEPPPPLPLSASYVSQSVPTTMVVGQSYPVTVVMNNRGTTTWTAANKFSLGSQNPGDNTTWGLGRVAVPGSVAQNANATFTFTAKAPTKAGTYNFQWRMVQDGVAWFGASTPNVAVTVQPSVVKGYVDAASSTAISGWACSTLLNSSINVHLYAGGAAGAGGTAAGTFVANKASETAIATACQASGKAYRYVIPITAAMVTAHGGKTIYVHGISPVGAGNPTLTNSGKFKLPTNQTPKVSLSAPANGAVVHAPGSFTLKASASDGDDGVASVSFYNGSSLLNTDTQAPYEYTAGNLAAGSYSFKAIVKDTRGASATSAVVNTTVNAYPTVSLSAPANNLTYAAPAKVTLSASAKDSDGSIASVVFYNGTTAVNTDTTSPYSYTLGDLAAGSYSFKAIAKDNRGASKTSAAITIKVVNNSAPSVTLTSPKAGAKGVAPASFTLAATAADSDGSIASVVFYNGTTAVNTDTTSPYSYTVSGLKAGSHTFKAVAKDNLGGSKTSASVTVTVSDPPQQSPTSLSRKYTYDQHQRLCRVDEPETGATFMGYDGANNLAWSAAGVSGTAAGCQASNASAVAPRRVDRSYDKRNRLLTLDFPDGNGNQVWTYTADGLPAQVTTSNNAGTSVVVNSYGYNKRRLLTTDTQKITGWGTYTVNNTYNANGHLQRLGYSANYDGMEVDYAPNALGQPTQAGTFATNVRYYPNGAIKQFTYGNGITHTMTQNARQLPARSLDSHNALTLDYSYDKLGNVNAITDLVDGRQTRSMRYDKLNRLTQTTSSMFGTANYGYDRLDNLLSMQVGGGNKKRNYGYYYDARNRLVNVTDRGTGATVIGLEYDAQGNLANKNGQVFTFDMGNRLRDVPDKEGQYSYDAMGRRAQNRRFAGGTSPTRSFYSQQGQLLFNQDQRLDKRREFIYLGGSLIAERSHPTKAATPVTVTYQHTDALGTPIASSDANKNIIERSEYEPYGQLVNRALTSGPGFTGHMQDPATGLTYMQQRYYDPILGRFLSVDPVTAYLLPGSNFNRYWYANNNPYKFTDPDGRIAETIWDVGNIAIGVSSAYSNFSEGNIGAGVVDSLGVVVDTAAAAIPVVPGGAGTAIRAARGADEVVDLAKAGRSGRQERLREVANDPKASSADRGWIKNEQRQIEQGNRTSIRNPPGKQLAHERGREAAKGYSYKHSNLQDKDLHRTQHKFDDQGRKNKERPLE